MSDMTTIAISNRESSMLRSKGKANEFCSFLSAYRLLDVIAHVIDLELPHPPVHKKMGINLAKSDVRNFWNFIKNFLQLADYSTFIWKLDADFAKIPTEFHII